MAIPKRLITVILVCASVLSTGCSKKKAPELRILSDQEALDLWNKAQSHEAVGKAVVKTIPGENGTMVISTQEFMLRMPVGGSVGMVTVCGGGCQVAPGGGSIANCQAIGCEPTGRGCTPLVCSGSCYVSHPCRPEATVGFFPEGAVL